MNLEMTILRKLLCIPILNIFIFAFMPYKAYKEFFLGYIEAHGKTVEEVWANATPRERELLSQYNIYDGSKREETTATSAECGEGDKEGTDTSGVSKTD